MCASRSSWQNTQTQIVFIESAVHKPKSHVPIKSCEKIILNVQVNGSCTVSTATSSSLSATLGRRRASSAKGKSPSWTLVTCLIKFERTLILYWLFDSSQVRIQPGLGLLLPSEQLHRGARSAAAADLEPWGRLLARLPDPERATDEHTRLGQRVSDQPVLRALGARAAWHERRTMRWSAFAGRSAQAAVGSHTMRDTFAVHVSDPGMYARQMTTKRGFRWAFVETDSRHPLLQACPKGSKHCSNGKCVNQKYVCDDQDDCGDGSDELDCQDRCRFHMNQLNSGQVCLEVKASSMARDLTLVRQVESPGNGGNYAQFSDCKWTLEGPQGTNIVLVVSKIFITRARNEDVSSLILTTAVFSKFLSHFSYFGAL